MSKNKISLACDRHGYELKEIIREWLVEEKNAEIVIDLVHPPDYDSVSSGIEQTKIICEAIQKDECRHAIMMCGTGVGFCMISNMFWGIRASNVSDTFTAERARKSQNAQVLTIGAWDLAPEKAKKVISAWYDEPFNWERASSVKNLAAFHKINDDLVPKPEWVSWSMGFSPDDQGEWFYPKKD